MRCVALRRVGGTQPSDRRKTIRREGAVDGDALEQLGLSAALLRGPRLKQLLRRLGAVRSRNPCGKCARQATGGK